MAPSAASEVASAMEIARHELDSSATPGTPITPDESTVSSDYAYAFDIDVSLANLRCNSDSADLVSRVS
jgi:hypothetical protein